MELFLREANGGVLISGTKAFNRKGRKGLAKVAKKSIIEIRTLLIFRSLLSEFGESGKNFIGMGKPPDCDGLSLSHAITTN